MKVRYFLFLLFCFCNLCVVNASVINIYDLNKGDIYNSSDILDVLPSSAGTSFYGGVSVAYLNGNDELIYAFTASNGMEFFDDTNLYLHDELEFRLGSTCREAYLKYGEEYTKLCGYLHIYSSDKSLSQIEYWQVNSLYDVSFSSFCSQNGTDVLMSNPCNNRDAKDIYNYFGLIMFKEYIPATFELVCEPLEVKKGDNVECGLEINASDTISEIALSFNNELYDVIQYTESEGIELIKNEDGTIILKSETGVVGEKLLLNVTLNFKDNVMNDVNIELNDIMYTTASGYEISSSATSSVTIYEEPVVEEDKVDIEIGEKESVDNEEINDNSGTTDATDNPDTTDITLTYVVFAFLLCVLLFITQLINMKKNF